MLPLARSRTALGSTGYPEGRPGGLACPEGCTGRPGGAALRVCQCRRGGWGVRASWLGGEDGIAMALDALGVCRAPHGGIICS